MNIRFNANQDHPVLFTTPSYGQGSGTQLHRYLVPEFMTKFLKDLGNQQFNFNWQTEDRFSDWGNEVVLRLPIHHSSYVVSVELCCDHIGQPALNPQRIESAGLVIRKKTNQGEFSWMLEDDEPIGWQTSVQGLADPDLDRHLCRDNILHPRNKKPTYTGEQTHPMHAQTIQDTKGKHRTILFGYLPVVGSYRPPQKVNPSNDEADKLSDELDQLLPWPYGYAKGANYTGQIWRQAWAVPVVNGQPINEFFQLLKALVEQHQLGLTENPDNQQLKSLTENIYFWKTNNTEANKLLYGDISTSSLQKDKSLWQYLTSFKPYSSHRLIEWLAKQEQQSNIDSRGRLTHLPVPYSDNISFTSSLVMTDAQARWLREALKQRVIKQGEELSQQIPVPKFDQGEDDLYQVIPFIRAKDNANKVRLYWGNEQASQLFRVAAPFDAEASRPSMIQVPSLKDLRKGLAKGPALITPPDTYKLLNALKLKKGVTEEVAGDPPPGGSGGIQWVLVFSLPIVTLVAMILLMIIVSLLNIVFFWMPWVKQWIPIPKVK